MGHPDEVRERRWPRFDLLEYLRALHYALTSQSPGLALAPFVPCFLFQDARRAPIQSAYECMMALADGTERSSHCNVVRSTQYLNSADAFV